MGIERRTLLSLLAALPAAFALPPWVGASAAREGETGDKGLVDAHCHLFNVTDLAAARFILVSFLGIYPRPSGPTLAERALERNLRGIINWLARDVPSAADEAETLGASMLAPAIVPDLSESEEAEVDRLKSQAEDAARAVEKERDRPADVAMEPPGRCRPVGGSGIASSFKAGIRWVKVLRSYRRQLVQSLAERHREAGYRPRLLCPALVDYSNWLGQTLTSPLPDQVAVMGKIAAQPDLPPVHGYAPFDPLRQALFTRGKAGVDGAWDPMALVREALNENGFAGVKLYPPMGFKPVANSADAGATYPPSAAAALGGHQAVGAALDSALDDFWAFCADQDVPVMAHGSNSNVAGPDYGYRADPTHWMALLARRPGLRIMLAHFGGFESVALGHGQAGSDCPWPVPFEDSWEGVIARHVQQHPDSHLYADISFLAEIYDGRAALRSQERIRRYLAFDPDARHLVFGSDWVMLGVHKGWGRRPPYAGKIAAFLADCGISGDRLERVMQGNALRFLGLGPGDSTRTRLLRFYANHGLPPERLPLPA